MAQISTLTATVSGLQKAVAELQPVVNDIKGTADAVKSDIIRTAATQKARFPEWAKSEVDQYANAKQAELEAEIAAAPDRVTVWTSNEVVLHPVPGALSNQTLVAINLPNTIAVKDVWYTLFRNTADFPGFNSIDVAAVQQGDQWVAVIKYVGNREAFLGLRLHALCLKK